MLVTDPVAIAGARGALLRMSAALLDYPLEETQQVIEDGRARQVIEEALQVLGESSPQRLPASKDLNTLQIGYTNTFLAGPRGKPVVPMVASAYQALVAGITPGNFLLNIQAFYKHFGLKAAEQDEGHVEEPDHLVAMLEFCSLLCHLEELALAKGKDPSPYWRAQRDFLQRYLTPLSSAVRARYRQLKTPELDATLAWLVQSLPDWCQAQHRQLVQVIEEAEGPAEQIIATTTVPQGLWD